MKQFLILMIVLLSFACLQIDVDEKTEVTQQEKEEIRRIWENSGDSTNVAPFGFYDLLQQPSLQTMINAGRIKWVRLGNLDLPDCQAFAQWFVDRGVEVLGIFENSYIKKYYDDPSFDITGAFSWVVSKNPGVKHWSIGNETEVFIWWPDEKGNKIYMTPTQYMPVFKKVFFYARENHPELTLMNAPTLGTNNGGVKLGKHIALGLGDLSHGIVSQEDVEIYNLRYSRTPGYYRLRIVCFNFYSYESDATDGFSFQRGKLSPQIRVWVTETGVEDWKKHLEYVRLIYPKMINMFGAEKIFWYTFSQYGFYDRADESNRLDHSLRSNLAPISLDPKHKGGYPEWSPLARVLLKIDD